MILFYTAEENRRLERSVCAKCRQVNWREYGYLVNGKFYCGACAGHYFGIHGCHDHYKNYVVNR